MSASIAIRKYGYLTLLIIVAIIGSLGVYRFSSDFFEIKNIEVAGSDLKLEVDQNRVSRNLLFFPGGKLREQILRDNPLVGEVIFKKLFPHTLVIMILPRTPIALIGTPSGMMGVDKTGVFLGEPSQKNTLPELRFNLSSAAIGQKITDPEILKSLDFISLTQNFLQLSFIEATGAALLVKAPKLDIIIAQNSNISETATTLQTLLVGFRIKGNLPASIDLRFDKPVVRF